MYPGEYAHLIANVSGSRDQNYTWHVQGPIIKDYDDNVYNSTYLTASLNLDPPTNMSQNDFKKSDLSFYWQPNKTTTTRIVSVEVKTPNGNCTDSRGYTVAKNNNSTDLQAEDFYVERNHPINLTDGRTTTRVLQQHQQWHNDFFFPDESYTSNGDLFFDFHRSYLAHFDAWRKIFGYPQIVPWNPSTPLPKGIDVDHKNRNNSYVPESLPSWFRNQPSSEGPQNRSVVFVRSFSGQNHLPAGHPLNNPGGPLITFIGPISGQFAFLNGHTLPMCEETDYSHNPRLYPLTQNALTDFPPDQKLLGCTLTTPFHNGVHSDVGGDTGDMSGTATAPKDPIFWRYHKFIDSVSSQRFFPSIPAFAMLHGALPSHGTLVDSTPPRIISQNPFRLDPFITSLPKITDKEKDIFGITNVTALSAEFSEPVKGVRPSDFIVSGSHATQVSGTGAGPYVFIGFTEPKIGPINVTFASGNISDISGNHFQGSSWRYFLVNSNIDRDKDGLQDGLEVNLFKSNPTKVDTDGDSIPDGFEATTKCLNPIVNDAMVMDMSMKLINKTGLDSDKDNKTNVQEFHNKTDPCSSSKLTHRTFVHIANNVISNRISSALSNDLNSSQYNNSAFIIGIKKIGNFGKTNTELQYNSFNREATSIVNNTKLSKHIALADGNVAKRILNDSNFFDSNSFYPTNTLKNQSQSQYTLVAMLNGKLHEVYWTDTSDVPSGIRNLPFILAYTLGMRGIF
jgi:hypothetical protein